MPVEGLQMSIAGSSKSTNLTQSTDIARSLQTWTPLLHVLTVVWLLLKAHYGAKGVGRAQGGHQGASRFDKQRTWTGGHCGCQFVLSVWTVRDENTVETGQEPQHCDDSSSFGSILTTGLQDVITKGSLNELPFPSKST